MGEEQTYRAFCEHFPLRQECYNPTPENVQRWKWHIKQAENMAKGEPLQKDDGPIAMLRLKRMVDFFSGFPMETRGIYADIAGRFPGFQVWACGSRVRGDYVDFEGDAEAVEARAAAGMKRKMRSDFDFWAAPDAEQVGDLPENVDRCRVRIPESQKIPIPMWDFEKLPPGEHQQVAALIVQGEWGKLAVIHDKYSLSTHSYCCDQEGLKNWFWWGLKNGKINYDRNAENGSTSTGNV